MIKKIDINELQVGMYIHDLDADWVDHNFIRTRFAVKTDKVLEKINKTSLKHVYIDTDKGINIDAAATAVEVQQELVNQEQQLAETKLGLEKQVPVAQEIKQAKSVFKEAHTVMQTLMTDFRLGKQVEVEAIEPITDKMVDSVFRNKDALVSLCRIKNKDQYTFMHSVGVAGLMITFARVLNFSHEAIKEIAVGGMLHDIGKMTTPNEILNKPGKLNDQEFFVMRDHVVQSRIILSQTPGITQNALDVAALHHERVDGSGYPDGLKGDEISLVGKMSTIVDVYDALTSIRCYKNAWEPSDALKKLLEWSSNHFEPKLVHEFIRCLGIYPVGTLVELDSGKVGLVIEQNEQDLLKPILRVFYSSNKRCYLPVKQLDLAKEKHDFIQSAVQPVKYNIDLGAFM